VSIKRFNKILVANRGEIAVRIIRACRELHIFSVAVYSSADVDSAHVALADEAVFLGAPEAAQSYLAIDKIIAAALAVGAQAIHPGYGFLAENPLLAQACSDSGLTFIGPTVDSMKAVAAKDAARTLAESLAVPTIPGLEGLASYDSALVAGCEGLGYPLLLKAAAGGGGLGMRIVEEAGALQEALAAVSRESKQAFANGGIIVEKYLGRARHIEVQLLADNYGHCVHLHERDCSIQRRRQIIIEESPARNLPAAIKQQLCHAAVAIARHIEYRGAGTVEFLVDGEHFYFLEMNTRLQVEHGVSEAVTGIDIVQWQIKIAEGEALSLQQSHIEQRGHAIECRLCAESPARDFMPASGRVNYWRGPNLQRCDSGIHAGSEISVYYDSLLAKVVSVGTDFSQANRNMRSALAQCALLGVDNNISYLANITASQPWIEGAIDTSAVANYHPLWSASAEGQNHHRLICAAVAVACKPSEQYWPGRQQRPDQWHVELAEQQLTVQTRWLSEQSLEVSIDDSVLRCELSGEHTLGASAGVPVLIFELLLEDQRRRFTAQWEYGEGSARVVSLHSDTAGAAQMTVYPAAAPRQGSSSQSVILAPMPAKIIAVDIAVGDRVAQGDSMLLLESMKMETRLAATRPGIIKSVFVSEGELVESGRPMFEFESE
jgi:3-methylcrotonyl-CoA carboxylase alpha subunit